MYYGNKFLFYTCNYNLQVRTIFGHNHVSDSFGRTTHTYFGHRRYFGQTFSETGTTSPYPARLTIINMLEAQSPGWPEIAGDGGLLKTHKFYTHLTHIIIDCS